MLPPFIIEQIREREERDREAESEQPRLELPVPAGPVRREVDESADRGIVEIQIW
jgi:hypothetical protein